MGKKLIWGHLLSELIIFLKWTEENGKVEKQYYATLKVFLIYCFCLGLGEIEEPPLKKKGWLVFFLSEQKVFLLW